MHYVVYGAGAVGGVIGGRLALAGREVTLVARGEHLAAIRDRGLTLDAGDGRHRIEAPATDIPEFFTVSVEGLEAGTQILAKDITLPEGVTLDSDEELLVVNITEQISAEALEAELADAEAEAGIEHDESDEAEAAEGAEGAEGESAEGDAAEGDDSEQE